MTKIEVPLADIFDKVSILEIKQSKTIDQIKLNNINTELNYLYDQVAEYKVNNNIHILYDKLKSINLQLWDIEDNIRLKENKKEFDSDFIALARSVYITNDERAKIKKQINIMLNSRLIEEKIYNHDQF